MSDLADTTPEGLIETVAELLADTNDRLDAAFSRAVAAEARAAGSADRADAIATTQEQALRRLEAIDVAMASIRGAQEATRPVAERVEILQERLDEVAALRTGIAELRVQGQRARHATRGRLARGRAGARAASPRRAAPPGRGAAGVSDARVYRALLAFIAERTGLDDLEAPRRVRVVSAQELRRLCNSYIARGYVDDVGGGYAIETARSTCAPTRRLHTGWRRWCTRRRTPSPWKFSGSLRPTVTSTPRPSGARRRRCSARFCSVTTGRATTAGPTRRRRGRQHGPSTSPIN